MSTAGPAEITIGTRLTDSATFDLTVQGTASGGMGFVVWGPDAAHGGEIWAAKMVHPGRWHRLPSQERAQLQDAFEREALTWCRLWPHSCIVRAYALTRLDGSWDHLPVLVLGYAPHGNLRDWLERAYRRDNVSPVVAAVGWAQQIASALVALHTPDEAHGRPTPLVHADLKPENVLIGPSYWAKLTDLGLTRAWAAGNSATGVVLSSGSTTGQEILPGADPITQPFTGSAASIASTIIPSSPLEPTIGSRGHVAGTPLYMPVEQWYGVDAIGPATDIYALGVVLYEMFAGVRGWPHEPDWTGLSPSDPHAASVAWYRGHRRGPMRRLRDTQVQALAMGPLALISPRDRAERMLRELDELVAECLAVDAARRPTAAAVQDRLGTIFVPVQVPAVPHTPVDEAAFWCNLGLSYGNLGRYTEQYEMTRRAVDLDPGEAVNWANLGLVLGKLGRYEEALTAFTQAELRLTHDQEAGKDRLVTTIPNNKGTMLLYLGRYAEAVAAYEQTLAQRPDLDDTSYSLAKAYVMWDEVEETAAAMRVKRLQAAYAAIKNVLREAPHYPGGRELEANILARLADAQSEGQGIE